MEVFFNQKENQFLTKILKIDIYGINDKMSKIEQIFDFKQYNQEVEKILNESSLHESYKLIYKRSSDYLKENEYSTYFLFSSNYYYFRQRDELNSLRRGDSNNFDKYKNALLNFECSFLNLLLDLVETSISSLCKKVVSIFECCQADRYPLKLMMEVKKIRDVLLSSPYYFPSVRFSVNKNVFRKTIHRYKSDVLHFVCHGEKNGDLVFFNGDASGIKRFSPEYLEKIIGVYRLKKIELIYINSCYSNNFLKKIITNNCKNYISYGLGYIGENDNDLAALFSENFYQELSTNRAKIVDVYEKVYNEFPDEYVYFNGNGINYKTRLLFKQFY